MTANQCIKSCFNCEFLSKGTAPSYDDPGEGWGCNHDEIVELPEVSGNDEVVAQAYAESCPGYQYKEWGSDDEPVYEPLTDEQLAELREIQIEADTQKMIEIGWLTPDGEPTDAYFRASDLAYDMSR